MRFTNAGIRALQARGINIRQQTGKKQHAESYAGRGMGLQELVNRANIQYRQLGIAFIWDAGTPVKWLPGGHTVVKEGTVDHIGVWNGRGIAFDDKETSTDALPAANVKTNQVEFLMDFAKAGGISFLLAAEPGRAGLAGQERGYEMISIPDFYPTPRKIVDRMLRGINLKSIKSILEPQAGKGDIVDYITDYIKANEYYFRYHKIDIDTIEIDHDLRHILKGKGYRVVHDDFLTYNTFKQYDLIIMNPPFINGDIHLLKALDMQKYGGKIVCLLNAETLKNPYTNTRKDLVRQLEELNASIEFIKDAFIDAERKTHVEIAMIKVDAPQTFRKSIILEGLRQEENFQKRVEPGNAVAEADFLKAIVAQYNFELKAGLNLLNEYFAMKPYILNSIKEGPLNGPVIKLKVGDTENDTEFWNTYIQAIRYKYWKALFDSDIFDQLFTSKLRYEYHNKIQDLQHYDFSEYNIYTIKAELVITMSRSIEDTIIELFDEFSHKHHWQDETSKNIHYYNGWKTNKAWKINKRVIIPLSAFDWSGRFRPVYEAQNKLMDIEKVFNYLDGGRTDHVDLKAILEKAEKEGQTKKIQLKYFTVTFYKKGTCHIELRDMELLKKFNIFGSQRKGWLPPSYGKVNYHDMNPVEQRVIDDFEGRDEYRKTMAKSDYYICNTVELLALAG